MTASEKRSEAVGFIKSIAKKNQYNQARPCYIWGKPQGKFPGRGDCSGTVRDVLLRAAGIDIGSNTSVQVDNALKGKGLIIERPSGNYFDESKLKPGDCLYFKGNASHTLSVGHVELYTGKDESYGHGSGMGPTRNGGKASLKSYCAGRTGARKALMAVRWIADDNDDKPMKLGDRPLTTGCKGDDVRELQNLLLQLSFGLPKYGSDGDYGSETAIAVKNYQIKNNLATTGGADLTTIQSIQAAASGEVLAKPDQSVKVSGGDAYIRVGPGVNYRDVGIAKSEAIYAFSGQLAEGWIGIIFKDRAAWVSAKYAEVI